MPSTATLTFLRRGGAYALSILVLYEVHEIRTELMGQNAALAVLVDRCTSR